VARASTAPANDTGELDELWSVPPEKFVAARDAAVKALRDAGDTKAAAELKNVKRPSPSAWLVNQLVRSAPKEVEALFDAGDALMKAQGRVLAGADPSEMHTAMREVRQATARAMKRANAILAEHGRKPTADLTRRVTHTLRSASLDRSLREVVLTARLTTDPSVDEIEALADVRVPGRVAHKKEPEPKRPSAREESAAKRAAEREAKKTAEREAREKRRAEAEAAAAEVDEARRAVSSAEADERRARAAAEEAKRELARARKALKVATAKHQRVLGRLRSRS